MAGNVVGEGHTDVDSGGFGESNYVPEEYTLSGGSSLLGIVGEFYYTSLLQNDTWVTDMDVSSFLKTGGPVVNVKGTPTIELLRVADSPAIDKADITYTPEYDQRGLPRSGVPDIGAFELQAKDDVSPGGNGCNTGLGLVFGLVGSLVIGMTRYTPSRNKPRT